MIYKKENLYSLNSIKKLKTKFFHICYWKNMKKSNDIFLI